MRSQKSCASLLRMRISGALLLLGAPEAARDRLRLAAADGRLPLAPARRARRLAELRVEGEDVRLDRRRDRRVLLHPVDEVARLPPVEVEELAGDRDARLPVAKRLGRPALDQVRVDVVLLLARVRGELVRVAL